MPYRNIENPYILDEAIEAAIKRKKDAAKRVKQLLEQKKQTKTELSFIRRLLTNNQKMTINEYMKICDLPKKRARERLRFLLRMLEEQHPEIKPFEVHGIGRQPSYVVDLNTETTFARTCKYLIEGTGTATIEKAYEANFLIYKDFSRHDDPYKMETMFYKPAQRKTIREIERIWVEYCRCIQPHRVTKWNMKKIERL